ncbi:FliH/SctL family protein [Microbacterium sp. NPDC056044]|uniref:FliH/SctL family protein n=1 Tax=Microbacterium sp. NPDC056044 TaxID=3345690 RepID=UPI0035E2F0C5
MSTDTFAPASFPRLQPAGAEAERELARVRGYADGHAEGYRIAAVAAAEAQERADAERAARDAEHARDIDLALQALEDAALALSRRTADLTAATQQQVFARAVELAGLILSGELASGEDSATAALRRATLTADEDEMREVRVHPEDLSTLERLGQCPQGIALAGDASLSRGDAIVVLADGLVDARIRSALDRARDSLEAGA